MNEHKGFSDWGKKILEENNYLFDEVIVREFKNLGYYEIEINGNVFRTGRPDEKTFLGIMKKINFEPIPESVRTNEMLKEEGLTETGEFRNGNSTSTRTFDR